jgi:putative phosphoribosyl transferase
VIQEDVAIPTDGVVLQGILRIPDEPMGVVVFAHGSGSGRLSPRNNTVARTLQESRLATLLVDLLTESEASDRRKVFDIGLLAERLHACTLWLQGEHTASSLSAAYFGASTGAGAALVAAAQHPGSVRAVVSRGGRPDLAGSLLQSVRVPTLLLVGSRDPEVLRLNQEALAALGGPKVLTIIDGASHLFEEPGTLDQVAALAADWFAECFGPPADR